MNEKHIDVFGFLFKMFRLLLKEAVYSKENR